MFYYKNVRDDSATIEKLLELSEKHTTEGQDLYYSRIRQQGLLWNYKRVGRVYLLLGMNKRRKVRRRVPARVKVPLIVPEQAGDTWSMDFMCDVLVNKEGSGRSTLLMILTGKLLLWKLLIPCQP